MASVPPEAHSSLSNAVMNLPMLLEAGFQPDLKRVTLPAKNMLYFDISKLAGPFLSVTFLLKRM